MKVALLVLDVRTNGGVRPHHVLGQAGVCLSEGVEEREEGERLAGGEMRLARRFWQLT